MDSVTKHTLYFIISQHHRSTSYHCSCLNYYVILSRYLSNAESRNAVNTVCIVIQMLLMLCWLRCVRNSTCHVVIIRCM